MRAPLRLAPLLLLLAGAQAHGQSPSRGIRLAFPAVSLASDASGVEVNPAGIGLLRGFELQLVATSLEGGTGGDGQALFVASPLFGPLSLGLGVQHIGSQTLEALARFQDYARLTFSAAVALGERLSLGISIHKQLGDAPGIDFTTWDLGLLWRPLRWISFGAVARDLSTPRLPLADGVTPPAGELALAARRPLPRTWVLGLGIRPGTERAFLGADLRMQEGGHGLDPRFDPAVRLLVEPLRGVLLGGTVEVRPRGGVTEVLGQLGLTLQLDTPRLRGSVGYSSYIEKGRGHNGFTVEARLHGFRERSLLTPRDRWVKVHLEGAIPEHLPPAGALLVSPRAPRWTQAQVLGVLGAARRDPRVSGVLLAFDDTSFGLAQAQEIAAAVRALRGAGKRVISHVNGASNAVYVAACAAERLYLHPLAGFNAVGFASSVLFLRGVLDKVGILPEFIAIGKYKSAPEAFERRSMSEPAKEARLALLHDVFEDLVTAIANGRKKDRAQVRALIDRAPLGPDEAVKEGLADGISYLDDLPKKLEKEGLRLSFIGDPGAPAGDRWGGYPRIAVIHVEGTIVDGKSSIDPIFRRQSAGAETIVPAIRRAAADPAVRAIVLRVNSPGGSAQASDRIWRALEEAQRRKPVVASFGNVAASGGYYVSAGAREIFADRATVTGSIGIFYGKYSLAGLFGKLDVNDETLKAGKRADLLTTARPWTVQERAVLGARVREFYEQFLARVARGRKLSRDAVHAVAQGRIWSGAAALRHKLVDRLGGLDEAIDRAKELGGLDRRALAVVQHLPQPGLLARLLGRFRVESELPGAVSAALSAAASPVYHLRSGEPWAILPFEIDLR